ncbi:PRD domain-containing protein [Bifidobacterium callitrichidarum]|uniref:Transcription antiterminator BglG n=1 Tax=Bifidobacterium callitrichidarum TaxID=2052941 RepID=A0A2U2NBW3_9BIFI|nr:PRD domain-containing protein [Bifidobacterium callitrichidarum]PWG66578.1 transcription antiterminator BglG [Bifidobacterium callitrichidarum]
MEILRVFNNNVVLAKDGGREVILTGRGLGFKAKPGMEVDRSKVARMFVPAPGRDPDHMAQLLGDIPPEIIRLVSETMDEIGMGDEAAQSPTLVMALADHVCGALRRAKNGIPAVPYPLGAEVRSLYEHEYQQGCMLLAALNRKLDNALAPGESIAFALHLVNAGFSTGDLSHTYTMTGMIQQLLDVIESSYGITLDEHSVNVGRFITHLRYLFVRIHQHDQLDSEPESIVSSIMQSYPKAVECARLIASLIELRLDATLTEDEIAYLTLHVARVTNQMSRSRSGAGNGAGQSPRHQQRNSSLAQ